MIKNIRNNLEIELPGMQSWNRMAVEPMQDSRTINEKIINYKEWSSEKNVKNMKKAAVLVCFFKKNNDCLLYTSPSPRDRTRSRMPSSA